MYLESLKTPTFWDWRAVVRTVQTWLPGGMHEWRLDVQQVMQRALRRPHEAEFRALTGLLAPGAVCLDLGANRGQSIDSLRLVVKAPSIIAFEPQARLVQRLRRSYPGVEVVRAAVGQEPGVMSLHVPSYRSYRFDALASTDRRYATAWFSSAMWRYDPAKVTLTIEEVPVVRLDDFSWGPVDFVKFDVQGMELAALRGAKNLLARDRPVLMIETPDDGVRQFVAGLGYQALPGAPRAVNTVFV